MADEITYTESTGCVFILIGTVVPKLKNDCNVNSHVTSQGHRGHLNPNSEVSTFKTLMKSHTLNQLVVFVSFSPEVPFHSTENQV